MGNAERLSDTDELLFKKIFYTIYPVPSSEEKAYRRVDGRKKKKPNLTTNETTYTKDSEEGKALINFIQAMEVNGKYKLNLDTLITPEDYYVPAIPDEGIFEDETGTTSALFAYSVARYILSHYIEDAEIIDHEKNLVFFLNQLDRSEQLLKKDSSLRLGQKWFDIFWIFYKKTTNLVKREKSDSLKISIQLHNRFWTNRIKNRDISDKSGSMFLYENELPTNFINEEIDTFIRGDYSPDWKTTCGSHPLFYKCIIDALNFANDNEPCLILGETGTGKELIAKLIHAASHRNKNKFIPLNCSGFTDTLFNSEISGIRKGVATDTGTRLGAFLAASGYKVVGDNIIPTEPLNDNAGTIFLDEINSLDLAHQAKLLRIIQEKEVQVVGETDTRKIELKVVCAANTDLLKLCSEEKFRSDLYFRISRGIVIIPPLREMPDSVPEIADGKLQALKVASKNGENIKLIDETYEKLKQYQWPGNVRELENVLYRAFMHALMEGSDTIEPEHIQFTEIAKARENNELSQEASREETIKRCIENLLQALGPEITGTETMNEFEKHLLIKYLKKHNWNVSAIGRELGLERATVNRKLEKYGLKHPSL